MKVKDITNYLEQLAPLAYQESYDNSGLLIGDPQQEVTGASITLDVTEAVIDEAIANGDNVIIAHHPLIFNGVKKLTGKHWVERCVIKAIQNKIALYAIHTNLDNIHTGVNRMIAEKLGLANLQVLNPKKDLLTKLVSFVPPENTQAVLDALYEAGGGEIGNYDHCSFKTEGTGSFRPGEKATPYVGTNNEDETVQENRIEIIFPSHISGKIIGALHKSHPYEEVAYYLTPLANKHQEVGSGMIGYLESPMDAEAFLKMLKSKMNTDCIRHTYICRKEIRKVALCGGAGSFLLNHAKSQGADIFITGDFKYHEFFEADDQIIIADIGHFESEQYTKDLLYDILSKKITNIAFRLSEVQTNPIKYL